MALCGLESISHGVDCGRLPLRWQTSPDVRDKSSRYHERTPASSNSEETLQGEEF